jgi:hypothetical protein
VVNASLAVPALKQRFAKLGETVSANSHTAIFVLVL